MKVKSRIGKRLISIILTLVILASGIALFPDKAYAAGWLDYANQTITLGTAVSASIKDGDYYGPVESGSNTYWHIYKFAMPKKGLLNIYLESLSDGYLPKGYDSSNYGNAFVIYSATNPDEMVWRIETVKIPRSYSTSRAMYYGSTEIALEEGEYYFAVRKYAVSDTPYYLTLSYKEPIINVSSISLTPSSLTMEVGEQRTITPTVLPNNATDKTIIWRSSNPSIVAVDNGTVKAISNGTASIIATSMDGEVSATCEVTIRCSHNYQTAVTPATTKSSGNISEICTKCGSRKSQTIYRISSINLAKASYTYNGKLRKPSVTIIDTQGNSLINGRDYKVSYPDVTTQVGIYRVEIDFMGNYSGTTRKQFKILPKCVNFTKVTPKKTSIVLKWKKATTDCGYEIACSTSKKFTKGSSHIVDIKKSKTVSKRILHLKPNQRYYVRIRTYKNVKANGQTTKLYSSWSKSKKITTK